MNLPSSIQQGTDPWRLGSTMPSLYFYLQDDGLNKDAKATPALSSLQEINLT
jgi:hypothetical protein